jgi:DNA polymerase-3 subunit alpha
LPREWAPHTPPPETADEETRQLLELAMQLEGMVRNVGMHAGGVLIAPGRLTDFCPLYSQSGAEGAAISQLDKDDVEAIGLVKFDFLGLTTLTILDWCLRYVKRLEPSSDIALDTLPLGDAATYKIFSAANTTAVFQFESRGMRDLLKRARPDRFEDIIALVALFRPGPMDLIPEYIERKHGRQVVPYLDPRLEAILGPTYGIMIYQEQVMQIAQVIGGYSLGSADLLRRAMGKKKPEEMALHRDIFVAGAVKNGMREPIAHEVFSLMEKFAGYGFNKSHAAAYAMVAFQTAYMKAHHAAAFMAANLSALMDDTDKVQQFHADAVANGLKVLPPDVNAGEHRFVPVDAKTLRYGLGAIKGTGESAIGAILRARSDGGPFRDLYDFCRRVDKRIVNRRTIEALVRAGAFDGIDDHRASLLATVPRALEAAEHAERHAQQVSLFGAADADDYEKHLPVRAPRWDERRRLAEEKNALGFYLSGHPFNAFRVELAAVMRTSLAELQPRNEPVLLAGLVSSFRTAMTRRGKMGIVVLDDGTAQVEVSIYSEIFEAQRELLKEDSPLIIQGKVTRDDYSGNVRVIAERLFDIVGVRARYARELRLLMNGEASTAAQAAAGRLRELLGPYRNGPCPVAVRYANGAAVCDVRLGEAWNVSPEDGLIEELRAWLKPENVQLVYS